MYSAISSTVPISLWHIEYLLLEDLTYIGTVKEIAFYFILSSEINVYQKWIKVIFSLQN